MPVLETVRNVFFLSTILELTLLRRNNIHFNRLNLIHVIKINGYKTWFAILREEHRLTVFENRVLRRIFRPKRDEVTGGWRKPHK
jgi:hypothetical protein